MTIQNQLSEGMHRVQIFPYACINAFKITIHIIISYAPFFLMLNLNGAFDLCLCRACR